MTSTIPPDLLPRVRQVLLPLVETEDDREDLLLDAFFLVDPLLYGISRQGSPNQFLNVCLKQLLAYDARSMPEHPLALFLRAASYRAPIHRAEFDALTALANTLGRLPAPPPPTTPTTNIDAPLVTLATPRGERRPTVFLSYAHKDAALAQRLIDDLRAAGHACWIDTTAIKGGNEWIMTIADGINNSYAMVVLVTREALQSRWVQDEILWARQRNKLLIPLLLENVFGETRFFPLNSYQAVTLFDTGYDAALPKLLEALPSPSLPQVEAAQETAPTVNRPNLRQLELAYLERLRLEELLSTEKYTPLAGTAQQQSKRAEMRAVFELLPMGKEREVLRETHRFENAVEEILKLRRAVLLGEPGGGKTTTIWKLAADLRNTAVADRQAPLPLLIRLGRWTDAEQSLPAFIATQLGELGASLDELLQEERAALLLDGLNELPVSQRPTKYPQVQRFIEQHPKLLAIVSCRELDYTVDLGVDRINITPLDPLRMREFATHYLDAEQGETLFWKLAGETARHWLNRFEQEMAEKLAEPARVFWTEPQLPSGIHWGYRWSGENDNSFWQEWLRVREKPSSLMVLARNPYMLLMLTSVYAEQGKLPENRGELFRLFVEKLLQREAIPAAEQTLLLEGLAKVAYKMQTHRAQDETGDALTVLPKDAISKYLDERLLYLAGSASLLTVGEQIRFTHQLLQEYFAARGMEDRIRGEQLRAADLWTPQRWWERTNWEEAAILLAGLHSNDCTPVVEWLAEANPEIAAQCITRSGAALAPATRERLREMWLPRLTDLQREPEAQARAAIGRALGQTGLDNRKGVGVVREAHGVILPDFDWIEIPGGEFQYGSEEKYSAKPQKLTLAAFAISRYPITFVQFQTFLDDPEGIANPQWFDGLAADEDDRQIREQGFKFDNHPRETVNWYQAIAFCRWLSWRLGGGFDLKRVDEWAVRLPTEYEWEKAARGTDARIYPYGNDYDAAKGNTYETGIGQTSAVGIFPHGASPYGVMDMSGNVWEWCLSNYEKPALELRKENLRNDKDRVLRG
ncbi:MAG TPA: SUMF1/EgtB/PvdO family nonheme iron enzyme, partial [Blastocatellia bacterium]|nr:SUMF1/EgtB/PvdO family nonheme iron enzyme [Blastocatellia bacterium]